MAINSGSLASADEVMNALGAMFKDGMQSIYEHDRDGWNANTHQSFKNLTYDTFITNGSVSTAYNLLYSAGSDAWYTPVWSTAGSSFWVIIDAKNIDTSAAIIGANDCATIQTGSNRWMLYATASATKEINRARVMKTLFYGSDGTDPFMSGTNVSGVSALYSASGVDVGLRGVYSSISGVAANWTQWNGTFADTTNNTHCQSWSRVNGDDGQGTVGLWIMPSGTILNSAYSAPVDETEVDTSAEVKSNPAMCTLAGSWSNGGFDCRVFFLCSGAVSWAHAGAGTTTDVEIDFYADNSIPVFQDGTAHASLTQHTYIGSRVDTSANITNAIATWTDSLTDTSVRTFYVSTDNGTNYASGGDTMIVRPTNQSSGLRIKWDNVRGNAGSIDWFNAWGLRYNWY